MFMPVIKFVAFFLLISFTVSAQRFKIVANISGQGGSIVSSSINPQQVTHLNYTYANIVNGKVALDSSRPHDVDNLKTLCSLRTINPDLKVLISIGGEEWSTGFVEATSSDDARELFITSVVNFVKKYQLDGVELHWLLNPTGRYLNKFSTKDHYNYAVLIEELRVALDEQSRLDRRELKNFYILSIAGSSKRQYLLYSKLKYVIDYIDFINVQTFNYNIEILNAGGVSGSTIAGHHTNLYASHMDSWQRRNADQTIRDYEVQGIPMHKLVLGISFKGKGFVNAYDENNGLCQMSDGHLKEDLSYKNIHTLYLHQQDYKRYWDKHAKAPYLYSKDKGIFISYDDKRSIRKKTKYVRKNKLGGALVNAYQDDDEGKLVTAVRRGLKRIRLPF